MNTKAPNAPPTIVPSRLRLLRAGDRPTPGAVGGSPGEVSPGDGTLPAGGESDCDGRGCDDAACAEGNGEPVTGVGRVVAVAGNNGCWESCVDVVDNDGVAGWMPASGTVPDGELDVCCAISMVVTVAVVAEEVLVETDGSDTPNSTRLGDSVSDNAVTRVVRLPSVVVDGRVELAVVITDTEDINDAVDAVEKEDDVEPVAAVSELCVVANECGDIEVSVELCDVRVDVDASTELGAVMDNELAAGVDSILKLKLVSLAADEGKDAAASSVNMLVLVTLLKPLTEEAFHISSISLTQSTPTTVSKTG